MNGHHIARIGERGRTLIESRRGEDAALQRTSNGDRDTVVSPDENLDIRMRLADAQPQSCFGGVLFLGDFPVPENEGGTCLHTSHHRHGKEP